MRKKIFLAGLISLTSAPLGAIHSRLIVPLRTLIGLQEAYMRRLQSYQHPFLIPLVTIPLATKRRDRIEEAEQRFNSQPMMRYRSSSLDADLLAQIVLYRHLQNICARWTTPHEAKLTLNLTHTKLQDELEVLVPGASLDDVLADIEKALEKQKGETCPAQASSFDRLRMSGLCKPILNKGDNNDSKTYHITRPRSSQHAHRSNRRFAATDSEASRGDDCDFELDDDPLDS